MRVLCPAKIRRLEEEGGEEKKSICYTKKSMAVFNKASDSGVNF